MTITLPLVSFIPSSAISLIGDEWGTLELAGEVLTSASSFGTRQGARLMVSLVDIAPATERVTVRGQEIEVSGVSAAGVAMLLARFPDLRKLFSGRDVGMEDILVVGGDLVAAIIAAGTGALATRPPSRLPAGSASTSRPISFRRSCG